MAAIMTLCFSDIANGFCKIRTLYLQTILIAKLLLFMKSCLQNSKHSCFFPSCIHKCTVCLYYKKNQTNFQVTDVNDEVPEFLKSKYTFSIHEGLSADVPVGMVKATDPDHNKLISYNINETIAYSSSGEIVQLAQVRSNL